MWKHALKKAMHLKQIDKTQLEYEFRYILHIFYSLVYVYCILFKNMIFTFTKVSAFIKLKRTCMYFIVIYFSIETLTSRQRINLSQLSLYVGKKQSEIIHLFYFTTIISIRYYFVLLFQYLFICIRVDIKNCLNFDDKRYSINILESKKY